MDVPVQPGDALSQPTRARVFALLDELHRAAGTEELAQQLGMHANGVRIHLERLAEAGLVTRSRERIARGRPRDVWSISPDAQPGGVPPSGYASLARWLVRSLAENGARVRDLEATGEQIGRDLAEEAGDGMVHEQRMFDALTAQGFQPEREPIAPGRVTYRLRNCPYRDAVRERQPLVCALHRGMTKGMLEQIDPDSRLVGFDAKDPDTAGCLIRVRGPIARQVPLADEAR